MIINQTITKKILENLVHQTFLNLGNLSSSSLLDSLKLLGFYYATNAGISINIEDLKTPDAKKKFIQNANDEIEFVSYQWQQGLLSDNERFQTIIDSWNIATESLKNRIVDYYQNFDPANNLYIMAFSGARGNMSQVRQLVGMRGLMSDQEGKIIDLPIQANFREGLSSIDYIISSYGARKGIVDTALKTADSGYLTRRLIYVAQDLIIRENDCKTKRGVLILFNHKTNPKTLYGRVIISLKNVSFPYDIYENFLLKEKKEKENILNVELIQKIKGLKKPVVLVIRSPLTCELKSSLCQKCYGWDLANQKLISLGEAVGIIAAQSIGEPGTQLTMRTFHTGGIFTGETLKQIHAPFSGKLFLPNNLKVFSYRTNHGINLLKLREKSILKLVNWQGIEQEITLDLGSYLYINNSSFVSKGSLIAECPKQSILPGPRRLKPIYTTLSGELRFEKIALHSIKKSLGMIKVVVNNGVLWITSGKILPLPKEAKYSFLQSKEYNSFVPLKAVNINKSFAKLKLITPKNGVISYDLSKDLICIFPFKKSKISSKIYLNINGLKKIIKNYTIKFIPIIKNFQYIDKYTILGFFYIFPLFSETIQILRYKKSNFITTLFLITTKDIWKIHSDQINNYIFFPGKKTLVRNGITLNNSSNLSKSGLFLKKDGFEMIFQNAIPVFLRRGTILNYKQSDFVLEQKILATLVNYTQQTEDIVQGLPKIEELIEARKPQSPSFLSSRPGVILRNIETEFETKLTNPIISQKIEKNVIYTEIDLLFSNLEKKVEKKKFLSIIHSIFLKKKATYFNNKLFKEKHIPSFFVPIQKGDVKGENYIFKIDKYNSIENDTIVEKEKEQQEIINFLKNIEEEENLHLYGKKTFNINNLNINGKKNSSIWGKLHRKIKSLNELTLISEVKMFSYNFEFTQNTLKSFINEKNEKLLLNTDISVVSSHSEKPVEDSYPYSIVYKNDRQDYILEMEKKNYLFLEQLNPITKYELPLTSRLIIKPGSFIDIGEPITEGIIDIHDLLTIIFNYHFLLDGTQKGTLKSLNKFQLLLVNSIQAIYQSQGVNIASKHIEIIIKQMTCKVKIKNGGDTPLFPGEFIHFSLINEISLILQEINKKRKLNKKIRSKIPSYEPKLLSATTSSLSKDGFLSAAGFQETRRVLTKAAIEGTCDWLRGLKESVIVGKLIPAGSSFLNYKNYLDNLYLFKK